MTTYQVVDFDAGKEKLKKEKEKQERARSFDAVGFDPTVLKELKTLVSAAVSLEEQLHAKIAQNHMSAKAAMDKMEKLVKSKGKKLTPVDLKEIDNLLKFIEDARKDADQESEDAKPALLQWRADWRGAWGELLSDPKKAASYIAERKKMLDRAPADLAMRKRIAEYVTRAKDIQKLAKQTTSKGAELAGNEKNEITDFLTEVKKLAEQCTKASTQGPVKQLELWIKNTKHKTRPDDKTLATYEEMFRTCEDLAKPTRGALKTLDIKLTTFKKTAARFDSANRKLAEKAYADASKLKKTAYENVKKISTAQDKAAKMQAGFKKLKK